MERASTRHSTLLHSARRSIGQAHAPDVVQEDRVGVVGLEQREVEEGVEAKQAALVNLDAHLTELLVFQLPLQGPRHVQLAVWHMKCIREHIDHGIDALPSEAPGRASEWVSVCVRERLGAGMRVRGGTRGAWRRWARGWDPQGDGFRTHGESRIEGAPLPRSSRRSYAQLRGSRDRH